jgi:hypothetical protein
MTLNLMRRWQLRKTSCEKIETSCANWRNDRANWINLRVIKAFHDRQINEHGGLPGLRDEGLLLSALSRPENAYHYSDPKPDIAELAAAYGFGLAKNHPFNDANNLGTGDG